MARTKNAARKNNKRKGGDEDESKGPSKKQLKRQRLEQKTERNRLRREEEARQAGAGAGAGSHKKHKDRSRSRSASRGRSAPPSSNKKESNFLSEDELFACYYALPKSPAAPPSAAFFQRLHAELTAYNAAHVPTPAMTSSRWALIAGVRSCARELWGDHVDVLPFGSFVTGLYLESSDVDLVIMHVSFGKKQIAVLLRALGNRLRAKGLAKDVTLIPSARVPLLKYTDCATGLPVDISMGIMDGVLSANLMSRLSGVYPSFRPLTLFLKAFMQSLGLADVFKGGISSYILQVMILFHIQVQEVMHAGNTAASSSSSAAAASASSSSSSHTPLSPTSNLGYLLFTFFELFGCTFDYATHGIRISDGKTNNAAAAAAGTAVAAGAECYLKRSTPGRYQADRPFLLSMEDPIQKERDIGSACFAIRRIQRCFALAREFLCREPAPPSADGAAGANASSKAAANSGGAEKAMASSEFTIDTVGSTPAENAPNAAAASSSSAAASGASHTAAASSSSAAPASAAAAAAAASSSAASSNFSSSFGFICSSLLRLPVRYSIAELKRAAIKQPGWNSVVAKLERIDKLRAAKEAKNQRAAERHSAESKKQKQRPAAAAAAAAASAESIDLTAAEESADEGGASSSESAADDDDDDDVEILEAGAFGTSRKPIPIDELELDEEDAEGDDEGQEGEEEQGPRTGKTTTEGQEVPAAAAAASPAASSSAPAAAASAASAPSSAPVDPDSLPIDGDALLLSNEHDANMEINFK